MQFAHDHSVDNLQKQRVDYLIFVRLSLTLGTTMVNSFKKKAAKQNHLLFFVNKNNNN